MKTRTLTAGLLMAGIAAAPAAAAKPETSCTPKTVGLNAKGVLVSHTLTQTAGADTEDRGDDRYSGDVTLDVKKANHKAAKGEQTVTVTDGRVKFHKQTAPAAGDRVKLTGKITKLAKKCDATGFEPTITAKKVGFKPAKKAKKA